MTNWPQYTYLALLLLGLGVGLAKHGQIREGEHSFWTSLFSGAITIWLLYEGGFFRNL